MAGTAVKKFNPSSFIFMLCTVFLHSFLPQAPPGKCVSKGRGPGDGSQNLWLICKPEEPA